MDKKERNEALQHFGLWALAIYFSVLITYAFRFVFPIPELAVLAATLMTIGWMLYFTLLIRLSKRLKDESSNPAKNKRDLGPEV